MNAQNSNNQQGEQQTEINQDTLNNTRIAFDVKTDVRDIAEALKGRKLIKKEIEDESIIVLFDQEIQNIALYIDTTKVEFPEIEKRLNEGGYILMVPEDKIEEQVTEEQVVEKTGTLPEKEYKYDPAIDKFLNIEDTTIFTDNFMKYDSQYIHPSRWNYYQTVEIIHNLSKKLKSVEENLSDSKVRDIMKEITVKEETAKNLLLEEAKSINEEVNQYLNKLIPFEKEIGMLSKQQREYYIKLKNKFNKLDSKIYPDNQ
ncbi:MAG: hypothetical protein AAFZ15_29450 [Bacteroidota bacterium]